ncbi:hypothetical protein P691DRAFT_779544 [Macrolepiota fuliginosa MF-IS2]|uniref:Uncharacterized protein n=1 Tax=Macrolepiota fuliginosa MF-IS2 TaxID=1400762 RepID=A0A9P5X185_9AGAR|nr:hypothetical protein P691DRAFT_779544 [Macrolepiota fuliginosa MF-IS2]
MTYALPLLAPPNTEFPIYDASTLPTEISSQLMGAVTSVNTNTANGSARPSSCAALNQAPQTQPSSLQTRALLNSPMRAQRLHPPLPANKYSPPSSQYPPHNHPLTALIFLTCLPCTHNFVPVSRHARPSTVHVHRS